MLSAAEVEFKHFPFINNCAALLSDTGQLTEADPVYREALAAYRRVLGDDHLDT
jgi:Tetratricopeptide repeat